MTHLSGEAGIIALAHHRGASSSSSGGAAVAGIRPNKITGGATARMKPRTLMLLAICLVMILSIVFVWLIPKSRLRRFDLVSDDGNVNASLAALRRNAIRPPPTKSNGGSVKSKGGAMDDDTLELKKKILEYNRLLADDDRNNREHQALTTAAAPLASTRRAQIAAVEILNPTPHNNHNKHRGGKAGNNKRGGSRNSSTHDAATLPPNTAASTPLSTSDSTAATTLRTYDDLIRRDTDPKFYVYNMTSENGHAGDLSPFSPMLVCDDVHVPFVPSHDARCEEFLAAVSSAASLSQDLPVVVNVSVPSWNAPNRLMHHFRVNVSFEPVVPKFEQRTIKFRFLIVVLSEWLEHIAVNSTSHLVAPPPPLALPPRREYVDDSYAIRCMVKVPQVLFPLEPFAEVAAYQLDRKLRIHRVPPTTFVALSIDWIKLQSIKRAEQDVKMVPEFLEASRVTNYDEWIDKDFVAFVRNVKVSTKHDDDDARRHSRFTLNTTHVWCSLQLFLREVQPLLYTPLRVPYSKQHPGWHRWFDVEFNEYPVSPGPLLALSQMVIFDCIIMNNDRSPNKNNFAVGGCKKCTDRRPSGLPPTVVHLDHGMSFYGKDALIPHNPIGKTPKKVRFCIFYAPLMRFLLRLDASFGGNNKESSWRAFMYDGIHPVAANVIGHDKIRDTGSMVVKVLNRLRYCIQQYNETAVLRP